MQKEVIVLKKQTVWMAIVAILMVAVHVAILAGTSDPVAAFVAFVAVACVAVAFAGFFVAFAAAAVAFAALAAALAAPFAGFAAALAFVAATAAAIIANDEHGVPIVCGLSAIVFYAGTVGTALFLVGHFWPTAGYAAFWWYALPVVGTAAAILILRAGERAGRRPFNMT